MGSIRFSARDALESGFFAIFACILVSSSVLSWTYHTIYDGSAFDNSRWARIGDAYQTISEGEGEDIVFIGSSVFYYGIDGECLDEATNYGMQHWNLAIRGDLPYSRLIELEKMKDSGIETVVIEAGPNTFQNGLGEPSSRELRWKVFSLENDVQTTEEMMKIILDNDMDYILKSDYERFGFVKETSSNGLDELAHRIIYLGQSRRDLSADGMLPEKGSEKWISAIKSPLINEDKKLSQEEFDEYVDHLVNGEFWKPVNSIHRNRESLDHIIDELEESGLEVILLSLPVHNDFKRSLSPGWWDPFNQTRNNLSEEFQFIDFTWDDWGDENFRDPIHFSEIGRERGCEAIAESLEHILGD